jgi:hypothetical protein
MLAGSALSGRSRNYPGIRVAKPRSWPRFRAAPHRRSSAQRDGDDRPQTRRLTEAAD